MRSLDNKTLAGIVDDDRYILARQSHRSLKRNPVGRHVGREQGMTAGKGGLMAQIEKRNFFAQHQRATDF